jgi:hypothetical protein
MKKLAKAIPFATMMAMHQMQACILTSAFQRVWDFYAKGEFLQGGQEEDPYRWFLQEEYALYQLFLEDRCQKLSRHWQRICVLRNIQIDIASNSIPQYQGLSVSFWGTIATFNIGWFIGKLPEYTEIGEILISAARPLIKRNWQIEIEDGFLLRSSRLPPCITFLHELTHLLLRMDFILTSQDWDPSSIQSNVSVFEHAYQAWVVQLLRSIHEDFSSCLSLNPFDELDAAYQASWGGRDEILVIMGVKLMLNGVAHVLGETMLLRRLAALHSLPTDFVCWSHTILSFPGSDGDPMIILDEPVLNSSRLLFEHHKTAFMALCRHLGWDDVIAAPAPPLPASESPSSERGAAEADVVVAHLGAESEEGE